MYNKIPYNEDKVNQNCDLNDREYREGKIALESYPQAIFVQMDAPCNHDCLFCSRPAVYRHFNIDEFHGEFFHALEPVFESVRQINLTGSGELLFHPEAQRNLEYFNRFKYAQKMFATNGSSLTPKMADFIVASENQYLVHISMHSSEQDLHRRMSRAGTYQAVAENIRYLSSIKQQSAGLKINLIFVATTENIHNLPDFIKYAYEMKADGVVVYYHYVYRMDQKPISCYFKQDFTNSMLEEAERVADEINGNGERKINVSLPPRFGKSYDIPGGVCNEAWSQVMINSSGDIISCDVAGDSYENLKGKRSFFDVWNGKYYTGLRTKLIKAEFDCAKFCFRANPNTVNELKSHIISRGRSPEELKEFLSE